MLSEIETSLKLTSLRHGVSTVMFCPICNSIMDCTRAVEITLLRDGSVIYCKVFCGRCYDGKINAPADIVKTAEQRLGCPVEIEIIDGRKYSPADWRMQDTVANM